MRLLHLLAGILLVLVAAGAHAGILSLTDDTRQALAAPAMETYSDPSARLSLAEVRSLPESAWQPAGQRSPHFGVGNASHWARMTVRNDRSDASLWYLEYADAMTQYVDLYRQDSEGRWQKTASGSMRPGGSAGLPARSPVFPLTIGPGQSMALYINAHGIYTVMMPVTLWTPESFHAKQKRVTLLHGVSLGVCSALAIYNIFIWLKMRIRTHLLLSLFVLGTMANTLALNGTLGHQMFPEHPELANRVFTLSYNLFSLLGLYFFLCFINITQQRLRLTLALAASYEALAIFFLLNGNGIVWTHMTISAGLLLSLSILCITLVMSRRGNRAAFFYFVGIAFFAVFATSFMLMIMGILPPSFLSYHGIEIGTTVQTLFISIALARNVRDAQLQSDTATSALIQAETQAIAAINSSNQRLSKTVAYRTRELLEAQQALVSRQKIAALGVMTAGVAHEVNNPNNFISAGAQNSIAIMENMSASLLALLNDDVDPAVHEQIQRFATDHKKLLTEVADASQRTQAIVHGLGVVSQLHQQERRLWHPDVGLRETLMLIRGKYRDIQIHDAIEPCPATLCAPAELNQAFMALLLNAATAMMAKAPHERHLEVTATPSADARSITIKIRDNGCGMTASVMARACEPFFSTGAGAGLGLSQAKSTLEALGGTLELDSAPDNGTTVTLMLPGRNTT